MKSLTQFATNEFPARASSLPELMLCETRGILMFLDLVQDHSGPAADTGSLAHEIIAKWHTNGFDMAAALQGVAAWKRQFPLADEEKAVAHAVAYSQDPRNRVTLFWAPEEEIRVQFPPHENDPTGQPVVVSGHIDQVREENGKLFIWDIKTGARGGMEMLNSYALQIAAYAIGATVKLGRPVNPGGLIRTATYLTKNCDPTTSPAGVFWHYPYELTEAGILIDGFLLRVAQIRRGDFAASPGSQCNYCPAGGVGECVAKIKTLI